MIKKVKRPKSVGDVLLQPLEETPFRTKIVDVVAKHYKATTNIWEVMDRSVQELQRKPPQELAHLSPKRLNRMLRFYVGRAMFDHIFKYVRTES